MPRTALNKLIPKADYYLIRSFPRIAQALDSQGSSLDRSEMDAYLKLLPAAIERWQAVTTSEVEMHSCVVAAIASLQTTFGSRNALEVEPTTPDGTSNPPAELGETADSVGDTELPDDPDAGCIGGPQAPRETKGRPSGSNGGDRR